MVVGLLCIRPLITPGKKLTHSCECSGATNRGSDLVSSGKMSDGQMSHLSKRQRSICRTLANVSQ